MSDDAGPPCRVARRRRRGAFGLDERRRPAPDRVEADLRALLVARFPDLVVLPIAGGTAVEQPAVDGSRAIAVVSPRGHAAILFVARASAEPGTPHALRERCRALGIPHATVSCLQEGRAALRGFGFEPSRGPMGAVPPDTRS